MKKTGYFKVVLLEFVSFLDGVLRSIDMLEEFPRQQTLLTIPDILAADQPSSQEIAFHFRVAVGKQIRIEVLAEVVLVFTVRL